MIFDALNCFYSKIYSFIRYQFVGLGSTFGPFVYIKTRLKFPFPSNRNSCKKLAKFSSMGRYATEPDNATKAAKARGSNLRVHFKVS